MSSAALEPTELIPAQTVLTLHSKAQMGVAEARALTDEIRASANRLWMLVAVAYERKAWRALGYDSWKGYVTEELAISESRSYQLVDTGKVMLAIAEATGADPAELDPVPARTVAKVKDRIPALRKALTGYLADNPDEYELAEVIAAALDTVKATAVKPAPEPVDHAWVVCPACRGGGDLGVGEDAEQMAVAMEKWLRRYLGG